MARELGDQGLQELREFWGKEFARFLKLSAILLCKIAR